MRFHHKVAVVTGAARGIGSATALRLAREGGRVGILDLSLDAAQETASVHDADPRVRAAGGSLFALAADMIDPAAVDAAIDGVVAGEGKLDVLVNNAGATRDDLLFRMDPLEWEFVLRTNLSSAFLGIRAAQRHMCAARSGAIVNLSSRSALGNRGQANYAAAKAGIQALTATAAIELGPYGVRVNAVAPGYIDTAMTAATAHRVGSTPAEHQAAVAAATPLRRIGRPSEVASVIAFLASDDASYVSGQTLYINGGAR